MNKIIAPIAGFLIFVVEFIEVACEFAIHALGFMAIMSGIFFTGVSVLYFVLMFVGGLASNGPHPAIMLPGLILAGLVSFGIGHRLLKFIGVLE